MFKAYIHDECWPAGAARCDGDTLVCNHCTIFRAGCSAGGGAGAGRGRGRPPGLGLLPRQKSLDSSLAAAQINQMELLARTHAAGPVRGSATNLYHQ